MIVKTKIQEMSTAELQYVCDNAHKAFINKEVPIKKSELSKGSILYQHFDELEKRLKQ